MVTDNDRPGVGAELRMMVDAGSLDEGPGQAGAAHFVEHMMFNGTENYPGNELIGVLESFGIAFGPDVNAWTSHGETGYQLGTRSSDFSEFELAVDVLAEWATSATLDDDEIEAERLVLLEELRTRAETRAGRIEAVIDPIHLAGTDRLGRDPAANYEAIESITGDALRDFYRTWYRPELITVIASGEFDAGDMIDAISAVFGEIETPATPVPVPAEDGHDYVSWPEPQAVVIAYPETTRTSVSVRWRVERPPVLTIAGQRAHHIQKLAFEVLDRRLRARADLGDAVALWSGTGYYWVTPQVQIRTVWAQGDAEDVHALLGELLATVEQVRQHGLGVAEFDAVRDYYRIHNRRWFDEQATVQDWDLVSEMINSARESNWFGGSDSEYNVANQIRQSVNRLDPQRVLDEMLLGEPLIVVHAPSTTLADLPDEAELVAAYDALVGTRAARGERIVAETALLPTAGEALPYTWTEVDDSGEPYLITFANGVSVAVERFVPAEHRFSFRAQSRGGTSIEDAELAPMLDRLFELVGPSGFESIDPVQLDRLHEVRDVWFNADVGRYSESIWGAADTADLEFVFQLMVLAFTEPTITEVEARRFDATWRAIASDRSAHPDYVEDPVGWALRYGSDPWHQPQPNIEDLDSLDVESQLAAWKRRFANPADFFFVFVGDLDRTQVFELASRYLAHLETSPSREAAVDRDPGLAGDERFAVVEAGTGDLARVKISWDVPYPSSGDANVRSDLVRVLVHSQLRDVIREDLGASYDPSLTLWLTEEPTPKAQTIIEVQGAPERIDEISAAIHDELDRLRQGQVDPDRLDRAVTQMVNAYALDSTQARVHRYILYETVSGRSWDERWERADVAQAVTPADLTAAINAIFPKDQSVEVHVVPAG